MRFSKWDGAAVLLTAGALVFFLGWHARSRAALGTYTVSGDRPLPQAAAYLSERPVYLPDGGELVDLNTATRKELMSLPGIGETRAQAILEYRDRYGPFQSPDRVMDVPGIGLGVYELLAPYVTVTTSE